MAQITEYLEILLAGVDLTFKQSTDLLDNIFEGSVSETQIAAFLTAMRAKEPAPAEIAGLATSLRNHAVAVNPGIDNMIDTCGTGGAKLKTFNISTAAAIVAAAAGAYVAKHGNRGITSKCGSADVLEQLGVNIDPGPKVVEKCIRDGHIGFMFAPKFHPAMKFVQPVRKALGFRTVFNILGPLANPAAAQAQVMGAADESLMTKIIETLKLLGLKHAIVVHSDGLDEISLISPTKILQLNDGEITAGTIDPADYEMDHADFARLKGGDAAGNAEIIKNILSGKETGPKRNIVLLNTSAALVAAGLAKDFKKGISMAREAIEDGRSRQTLEKFIELSNS